MRSAKAAIVEYTAWVGLKADIIFSGSGGWNPRGRAPHAFSLADGGSQGVLASFSKDTCPIWLAPSTLITSFNRNDLFESPLSTYFMNQDFKIWIWGNIICLITTFTAIFNDKFHSVANPLIQSPEVFLHFPPISLQLKNNNKKI